MSEMRTFEEQKVSYAEKVAYLCSVLGDETVSTYDFYRDIFPEGFLQDAYKANPNAPHDGKYVAIANALYTRKRDGGTYRKNRYVTDDLSALLKLKPNIAFISPCSFLGGKKDLEHLRFVHALVVDLDYVDIPQIKDLVHQCTIGYLPTPTYVVNSGTGLHLYYVFEKPLRVYPNQQPALSALKHALIDLCWNDYTSLGDERQYSGLVQPYRIVGSRTKLDVEKATEKVVSQDYPVMAWKYGDKWTVEKLLRFEPSVSVGHRWRKNMDEVERLLHPEKDPEHLTLDKAKKLYPDWYDRRILHGEPPKKLEEYRWHVNRAVYDKWLARIREEAKEGHRYHCIMCLAIYALKCDVPWDELRQDAYSLLAKFESRTTDETNHFTVSDIDQALKAYKQPNYHRFTSKQVAYFSGLYIEKDKTRKGRKQGEHLARARVLQQFDDPEGRWRNKDGRPKGSKNKRYPKAELIREYAAEHPEASNRQIAEALGVSRNTVNKWLKGL